MKVLLINLPHDVDRVSGFPPSGLAYVGAALVRAGHDVSVLDIDGECLDQASVLARLHSTSKPAVVGISAYITQFNYAIWLIKELRLRWKNSRIVVGGMLAGSIPDLVLQRTETDVIVEGEGEDTIVELLEHFETERCLDDVRGIRFRPSGSDTIRATPPREVIKDLERLPYPAWDLFPVESYMKVPLYLRGKVRRHLPITPSRGCPFRCTFCDRQFHTKVRVRSIPNVIAEIRYLKEHFNLDHVDFENELFTVNRKWARELCEALIEQKLGLTWTADCRADQMSPELLSLMKQAGCIKTFYGLESGSQAILDSLAKHLKVQDIDKTLALHRELGVKCRSLFLLGSPGETRETALETVKLCQRHKITIGRVGVWSALFDTDLAFVTPFPGTPLYNQIKNKIPNHDEFIDRLGDWWSKPLGAYSEVACNMTEFSDDELYQLRHEMATMINNYFIRHHLFEYIIGIVQRFFEGVANRISRIRVMAKGHKRYVPRRLNRPDNPVSDGKRSLIPNAVRPGN